MTSAITTAPSTTPAGEYPFMCFHVKRKPMAVTGATSYQAAQRAAKAWGLKSTAGVDAHRMDVALSTADL